ncbi:hypothetical protein TNIN_426941 [Trichonephila inaurata madagascariensis]|uniref:Uncharacterized protein n=1 Tax=Trichonephila inaurata madagascariensis TaxID=2747483 RepID=A0A8X7CH75_9ARAC|nr:hypothetical protein TNIN_426941 [Trichonephila inaurata madagascariensis]
MSADDLRSLHKSHDASSPIPRKRTRLLDPCVACEIKKGNTPNPFPYLLENLKRFKKRKVKYYPRKNTINSKVSTTDSKLNAQAGHAHDSKQSCAKEKKIPNLNESFSSFDDSVGIINGIMNLNILAFVFKNEVRCKMCNSGLDMQVLKVSKDTDCINANHMSSAMFVKNAEKGSNVQQRPFLTSGSHSSSPAITLINKRNERMSPLRFGVTILEPFAFPSSTSTCLPPRKNSCSFLNYFYLVLFRL